MNGIPISNDRFQKRHREPASKNLMIQIGIMTTKQIPPNPLPQDNSIRPHARRWSPNFHPGNRLTFRLQPRRTQRLIYWFFLFRTTNSDFIRPPEIQISHWPENKCSPNAKMQCRYFRHSGKNGTSKSHYWSNLARRSSWYFSWSADSSVAEFRSLRIFLKEPNRLVM